MRFKIITTFPLIIKAVVGESILKRAREKGIVEIEAVNLRDFTKDRHRSTDDEPYGGGPGMVMLCEPVFRAVEALKEQIEENSPRVLFMSPAGRTFDQKFAEELSNEEQIIIICGHYEGADERIIDKLVTDEVSVGDYVLTGGELPALVIVDAVTRLLPGVLGDDESSVLESFSSGLLEHPQYTRPADFEGNAVPEVLLSGNHAEIAKWRRKQALKRTFERRPDLLESAELSKTDIKYLKEIGY